MRSVPQRTHLVMMPIPEEVRIVLLTEVRAQLRAAPDKVVCLRNMDMEIKPAPGDALDAVCALLSADCTSFGVHDFNFAGVPARMVYDDAYLSRNAESGVLRRNNIASDMFKKEIYGDVYLEARVEIE